MHLIVISFEDVQKNQHDHFKKSEKRWLHHFQNVSTHNFFEYHEQDHKVDHKQINRMINEDVSIIIQLLHEMS
jgi:ABC-type xylose transport system substrate-binding protein